ncbi:MAG: alkaline phosphatase [candidate division Zixibacteria bacterium RBG_16_50_21]|nr:MAG: alkaline phosphatase [candidate division Zixibacteria bacterium RBG_16_50_21]
MVEKILAPIAAWLVSVISTLGYFGIVLTMAIESACIPLPSEIIMPFSGYLVSAGRFNLWLTGIAGAMGCVIGSVIAYWAGIKGGRPFLEKYGRYVLISKHDLDNADKFFQKYGDWSIFISRLLPVIRTFISLPAGIAKMRFGRFVVLTFLGSLPWCLALAYIGQVMGENWEQIKVYFRKADIIIGVLIVTGLVWFLYRHLRK